MIKREQTKSHLIMRYLFIAVVNGLNEFVRYDTLLLGWKQFLTNYCFSVAAITSGATYSIIAKHSGKGLDVKDASTASGAAIQARKKAHLPISGMRLL
jgi:hypothetical protein